VLKQSRNFLAAAAIVALLAGATALATAKPSPELIDAPKAVDSTVLTS
jgi:hypothetical protein